MKIKNWFIIVVLVCLVLGTLLHFTYEWSGEDKIVAIYSAVNESTWEHLKLVFYPMTIMAIIGTFVMNKQKNTPNINKVVDVNTIDFINFLSC